MATATEPKLAKQKRAAKGPYSDGWSYVYVGWWNIVYHFKIRVLGPLLSISVVFFSGIELFGPLTHLADDFLPSSFLPTWRTPWIHYAVTICLIVAATIMVLHHRFLERETERLKRLLAFTVVTGTNLRALSSTDHNSQTAVQVLDGLILSLVGHSSTSAAKRQLNASILVRAGAEQTFRIYAQDSANALDSDTAIPAQKSVAGKVLEYDGEAEDPGTLLYVPSTRYVHGVAFRGGSVSFRETEISPATYRAVNQTTERDVLKCLLCVQIPLKHPESARKEGHPDSCSSAVLSLSSREEDSMDSIHFLASKLAADLIAQFLS